MAGLLRSPGSGIVDRGEHHPGTNKPTTTDRRFPLIAKTTAAADHNWGQDDSHQQEVDNRPIAVEVHQSGEDVGLEKPTLRP